MGDAGAWGRRQRPSRRAVLGGALASGLLPALARAHAAEPFVLPPEFEPTVVRLDAGLAPGEIHVLPNIFRLYWTLSGGEAIRFAIGVGRPGLYHAGTFIVGAKREWPAWKPTAAMIERDPARYGPLADGLPGGPGNPLGARALYLHDEEGRDTLLRIHGTDAPDTIGTAVSNGCARLTNEHVTQLYDLVPLGTRVVLYEQGVPEALA